MPHICTRCNNVFHSGEDILKGCPKCGWKKFMFVKKGQNGQQAQAERIITREMGVRIPPRARDAQDSISQQTRPGPVTAPAIQSGSPVKKDAPAAPERMAEKALESVKITAPGTYELNLPSLFERDELIMAVKEGTYFIDLTSAFKKGRKE